MSEKLHDDLIDTKEAIETEETTNDFDTLVPQESSEADILDSAPEAPVEETLGAPEAEGQPNAEPEAPAAKEQQSAEAEQRRAEIQAKIAKEEEWHERQVSYGKQLAEGALRRRYGDEAMNRDFGTYERDDQGRLRLDACGSLRYSLERATESAVNWRDMSKEYRDDFRSRNSRECNGFPDSYVQKVEAHLRDEFANVKKYMDDYQFDLDDRAKFMSPMLYIRGGQDSYINTIEAQTGRFGEERLHELSSAIRASEELSPEEKAKWEEEIDSFDGTAMKHINLMPVDIEETRELIDRYATGREYDYARNTAHNEVIEKINRLNDLAKKLGTTPLMYRNFQTRPFGVEQKPETTEYMLSDRGAVESYITVYFRRKAENERARREAELLEQQREEERAKTERERAEGQALRDFINRFHITDSETGF